MEIKMEEIWKPVKGYENYLLVSNLGRVKAVKRFGVKEHLFVPVKKKSGYLGICLKVKKDGISKNLKIHRMVAEAFIENKDNKKLINHIDEDKTNNRYDNLEWCTAKENANHGTRNKRILDTKKKNGTLLGANHKKCKCLETGMVFNSQSDAARYFDTPAQHISICCKDEWRTTRGYHFRFI